MHALTLIFRTFGHYWRQNLWASLGFAVATAVATGALVIGDSMRHSLELTVRHRLGAITHTVTAGERYFTQGLGHRLGQALGAQASTAMLTEGMAMVEGGALRIERLQVVGVDSMFGPVMGVAFPYHALGMGEVAISQNVAERLSLAQGDYMQLSIRRASLVPLNTPLVSEANQTVSRRVRVTRIAPDREYGRFNLQVSQTPPHNVFVNIGWLNSIMGLQGRANLVALALPPDASPQGVVDAIADSWSLGDINLTLAPLEPHGLIEVASERVFIQEPLAGVMARLFPTGTVHLTYLVNSLRHAERITPYSFVAADDRFGLAPGQIAISQWLARDLGATQGDRLQARYFEVGPLRELRVREATFTVAQVIDSEALPQDRTLMPHIPGLSDSESCAEWEAGIPIDLEAIRPKDEEYWRLHRGTPKAYISLAQGQQLWGNRFGNATALRLPAQGNDAQAVARDILRAIGPGAMGFQVNAVRERGLHAARHAVDFAELFAGLAFFVLASGMVLSLLLVGFNLVRRRPQLELLWALGFRPRLIRFIYLGEGLVVSLVGGLLGLALAVGYSHLVFAALNRVWHGIVRTQLMELLITPKALAMGLAIGVAISFVAVMAMTSRYLSRGKPRGSTQGRANRPSPTVGLLLGIPLGAAGLGIPLASLALGAGLSPPGFFASGVLLLAGLIAMAHWAMARLADRAMRSVNLPLMALRSLARNRTRSLTTVVLLALGTFLVVSTGIHRRFANPADAAKQGGTGGFAWVAETTIPVPYNLNDERIRADLHIPPSVGFVQMSTTFADDASCLNLNRVANPRVMGVDPAQLQGRFRFAGLWDQAYAAAPWAMLRMDLGGAVPAIADQTVIQWGLGKQLGDTLTYTDQQGQPVHLKLVGGLASSVFQGNVLICNQQFIRHFPAASGSRFFLIHADTPHSAHGDELALTFRGFGWAMQGAAQRLASFSEVENTYLGIFHAMGAFGLLLGTIGLAIVLARGATERAAEVALLWAVGYPQRLIRRLFVLENGLLLVVGIAVGTLSALVASLPMPKAPDGGASLAALIALLALIALHGWLWVLIITRFRLQRFSPARALRND